MSQGQMSRGAKKRLVWYAIYGVLGLAYVAVPSGRPALAALLGLFGLSFVLLAGVTTFIVRHVPIADPPSQGDLWLLFGHGALMVTMAVLAALPNGPS